MAIEIKEYLDLDGQSPYGKWFDDLDARAAAKIATAIDKIGRGLLGDVKAVGGGVSERRSERRLAYGPGYRIYFGSETDRGITKVVVLLGGGTKGSQNADISRAKVLWTEYKTRKRRGEG